jgi:hypothetical protein
MEHMTTIHTNTPYGMEDGEAYCFWPLDIPLHKTQTTRMYKEVMEQLKKSKNPLDKKLLDLIEDIDTDYYGSFKTYLDYDKVEKMDSKEQREVAERLWDIIGGAPCMSYFYSIHDYDVYEEEHYPDVESRECMLSNYVNALDELGYTIDWDTIKDENPKQTTYINKLEKETA